MENARLVGRNLHVLDTSGVAPDAEAVIGETTAADDLLVVGAPAEAGDLGVGSDVVDAGTCGGVPEVDLTIVGAAAGGEKVRLPWAPGESLDRSAVVSLGELGGVQSAGVPDVDHVVVAAGSELGTIGAPLETADLSSMGDELGNLMLCDADVVVVDETRASTGGEKVLVPSHDTNAGLVAEHAAELGLLLNVPDLDLTRTKANANVRTVT